MSTIEKRVKELERTGTGTGGDQPLLVVQYGNELDAVQVAAVLEAERSDRQVIRVRFVQPDKATKEQV